MKEKTVNSNPYYNKYFYTGFLLAAIIFTCLKDFSTAMIFGGIGLVFDPFNQQTAFQQRPAWQRVWLIAHLVFVFIVLGMTVKGI